MNAQKNWRDLLAAILIFPCLAWAIYIDKYGSAVLLSVCAVMFLYWYKQRFGEYL